VDQQVRRQRLDQRRRLRRAHVEDVELGSAGRFSRRPLDRSSSTITRSPAARKGLGEMGADEPGAAGDEDGGHDRRRA
jgi:hypothetical protein